MYIVSSNFFSKRLQTAIARNYANPLSKLHTVVLYPNKFNKHQTPEKSTQNTQVFTLNISQINMETKMSKLFIDSILKYCMCETEAV